MSPFYPSSESTNASGENSSRSVHLFADADEADGQIHLLGDGDGDAALGGAVELGEDDAGDAGGLRKQPRLLQAVLAGGCVHHQQHFVRRAGDQARGGAAHLVELVHQSGLGVQAAGCVHVEILNAARLGGGNGVIEHGSGSPPCRS